MGTQHYAPGMRVEIRDAEWRIKRVDHSSDGGYILTCEGQSELVLGHEGLFLSELDQPRILDPRHTQLVDDTSGNFGDSLLYLDSLLRKTAPSDQRLHLRHRAAIDQLEFQLQPALQALAQRRQGVLIADVVGLGKTLEAGILTSELIARGRGKRILVLAVKSMLTQFQQEFWNRFTIPLVRLDSSGLQRVRSRIPANHNPFHYLTARLSPSTPSSRTSNTVITLPGGPTERTVEYHAPFFKPDREQDYRAAWTFFAGQDD